MGGNVLFTIKPYKWEGMWVFDDERVGLDKEPFVGGADTIIDTAVALKGIRNPAKGFLMVFSAGPFPGADLELEWVREEFDGNVYRWTQTGQEGWLCPALFHYFDEAPRKLYVQLRQAS